MNDHCERILGQLPLPLSRSWRRIAFLKEPRGIHERAFFTLEAVLKYLAGMAASAWVVAGARGEKARKACESLVQPSLGHWAEILRSCVEVLPFSSPVGIWLKKILAREIIGGLSEAGGGTIGRTLEELPFYRNRIAHGAGLDVDLIEEKCEKIVAVCLVLLDVFIEDGAPELLGRLGRSWVRLMGPNGIPCNFDGESPGKGTVFLRHGNRLLQLSPLWIYDGSWDDVLVLNRGAGQERVEYLSYGLPHGEMGLILRRGEEAREAREFYLLATGRSEIADAELEELLEEAEVGELAGRASEERIGPFRVIRQMAVGGQGVLYEAIQEEPPRRVALKVLKPGRALDEVARLRFAEESKALAKVEHPGIVPVYQSGESIDAPWIAMKFIEGKSLAEILAALKGHEGALSLGEWERASERTEIPCETGTKKLHVGRVAELGRDVARALQACHDRGVLHRDVKPGNVMVDRQGRAYLTDFGLAREVESGSGTLTGEFVGTLHYAAPEALSGGRVVWGPQVDVYGLGATLYELLSLQRPFGAHEGNEGGLLRAIQVEEPEPLRRLAPWIPRDLEVIVGKALEKDCARRYGSAGELGDDLERYLAGEPILARPSGPMTRIRKWSRRHPGRYVGILSLAVLFLVTLGYLWAAKEVKARAVGKLLAEAEELLLADDCLGARGAATRALERGALLAQVGGLLERIKFAENTKQKAADLSKAEKVRNEVRRMMEEYRRARQETEVLDFEVGQEKLVCFESYVSAVQRAALAAREIEMHRRRMENKAALRKIRQYLEEAVLLEDKWGSITEATRFSFASFFFDLFEEARKLGDTENARLMVAQVQRYDQEGRYAERLNGGNTLELSVSPPTAKAYLFRYEPYEVIRREPPVVSRLVPVPTNGRGLAWAEASIEAFHPGDLCQVITEVAKDSLAWKNGLRRGDLVIRLQDHSCGDGLFVRGILQDGPADRAGVRPLDRLQQIQGTPVEGTQEWQVAIIDGQDQMIQLAISGQKVPVTCRGQDLQPSSPGELIETNAPASMNLLCLRRGDLLVLEVPNGECSGIRCAPTAYPLICSPANRIEPGLASPIESGSYLLYVAGDEKFADQLYPFVVPHLGKVELRIDLLKLGDVPPGFVYIPPGVFVAGGDDQAISSVWRREVDLPGFFLARREVSNSEWFDFLNDPEILAEIEKGVETIYLPRKHDGISYKILAKKLPSGIYEPIPRNWTSPVGGISYDDIQRYLSWRNRKALQEGECWSYRLPTNEEWEKAARGVDGRCFPWGNRFDYSLAVSGFWKPELIFKLGVPPSGTEPRDSSPFGVQDMAGSIMEWLGGNDETGSGENPLRGGAFLADEPRLFRAATRGGRLPDTVDVIYGFRLVADRRR